MSELVIGIDVGGTNVKMGLIDHKARIIFRTNLLTKTYIRNKNRLIQAIVVKIDEILRINKFSRKEIKAIGIGLPGLVDPSEGKVIFLPNIPGWKNVPLRQIFHKLLRISTYIENDVNLVTLGEWKFGSGCGVQNMICATLGTGVGGGLIINNQLYRGEGYTAGEIGHIPINEEGPLCNCSGHACLERYVGNKYLRQQAAKLFKEKNITLEKVTTLAQKGNLKALRFWDQTAKHIGHALTGVVNVLNPSRIVLGGGISNSKFIFKTIQQTIRLRAMKVQGRMVKIVPAQLGNDAGILGAFVLIQEELKKRNHRR